MFLNFFSLFRCYICKCNCINYFNIEYCRLVNRKFCRVYSVVRKGYRVDFLFCFVGEVMGKILSINGKLMSEGRNR